MSNAIVDDVEGYDSLKSTDSPYRRYNCQEGNPLGCQVFKAVAQPDRLVQGCPVCSFPIPLTEKAEIQGQVGIYRIDEWVGTRGLGRLYRATLLGLNQTVVIKEYLLPQLHFSAEEIRQRQQTFAQVAGIVLPERGDPAVRRAEPVAAGIQGRRGNEEMAGRRVRRAEGDHDGAGPGQAAIDP